MDIKKEYERWLVNATADTDVADVVIYFVIIAVVHILGAIKNNGHSLCFSLQ